jgi:hypothetical protein
MSAVVTPLLVVRTFVVSVVGTPLLVNGLLVGDVIAIAGAVVVEAKLIVDGDAGDVVEAVVTVPATVAVVV